MQTNRPARGTIRAALLTSISTLSLLTAAFAQDASKSFDVPAQSASSGIPEFAREANIQILVNADDVDGKTTNAVRGNLPVHQALQRLIAGTGLSIASDDGRAITLSRGDRSKNAEAASNEAATSEGLAIETVTVTGSRLGAAAAAASPITTIGQKDISLSGSNDIGAVLRQQPAIFAGSFSPEGTGAGVDGGPESQSSNASFGSSINIHGLDSAATLDLFDGRRLPTGSSGASPDVSLIPAVALDHIDVVLDGAAPIYGSDAIGGVVNFLPKKDFDGALSTAQIGSVTQGGYSTEQISQLLGTTWDGGGAEVAYEYDHNSALRSSDRQATELLSPRTILPSQEQNSFYGRIDQSFGNIDLWADALVSRRSLNQFTDSANLLFREDIATAQQVVSGGASIKLPGDWLATGYVQYAQNTVSSIVDLSDVFDYRLSYGGSNIDAEVSVKGSVFQLPAGNVIVVGGFNYHDEHRDFIATPGPPSRDQRELYAFFGEGEAPLISSEMQVPAVQRLMLTAAVRYDHYSDVGGTTNPKLGLIWDVVDGLRIRSTYSTSFRAPSLYDTSQAGFAVDGFFLPDSESPTGQSLALFLSGSSQPNLKPETAHNVTVGGTATPSWFPGFTASASYFNVNYTNQIAYPDTAVRNLFDPTAPDTQPFLIRNPSAAIVQPLLDSPQFFNLTPGPVSASDVQLLIDDRATNLAKTKVSGIDFSFGYAIGEFGFSALGTWMLNYDTSATSNPPVDHVGTAFFPPRLKTRIGATWTRSGLSAGGYWNFNPSYKDARYDDRPISENNTFDANVEYAFSDSDSDVLSGVSITLIANNIFDAKPPTIESPTPITFPTYDPANASLIGRFLSLAISKRW